jgi:hypothetical protein
MNRPLSTRTAVLEARIDQETYNWVAELAAANGMSISAMADRLLRHVRTLPATQLARAIAGRPVVIE